MSAPEFSVPIEDEILEALTSVSPDLEDGQFRVLSEGGADFAARLIIRAEEAFAKDSALYNVQMEPIRRQSQRLDDWIEGRAAVLQAVKDRWKPELEEWHARQREIYTTRKGEERVRNASITLPSGTRLTSTRQPPTAKVSDLDAFYAFVADNLPAELAEKVVTVVPQHVVPEERTPNLAGIKAVFEAKADEGDTGPFVLGSHTVPGVYAERGPTKFGVVTPKGGE